MVFFVTLIATSFTDFCLYFYKSVHILMPLLLQVSSYIVNIHIIYIEYKTNYVCVTNRFNVSPFFYGYKRYMILFCTRIFHILLIPLNCMQLQTCSECKCASSLNFAHFKGSIILNECKARRVAKSVQHSCEQNANML